LDKRTVVGLATIGQSPRVDLVPEIKAVAGVDAEYLECGALDGLSLPEIEKLAPEEGEYMLVTRLNDGSQVRVARSKIIDKMQECTDKLVEQGADLVVILCVGEWPKFESEKLVVTPSEPFCGFVMGLLRDGDKLGVIVPAQDQIEDFRQKWNKEGVGVIVTFASPYGPTTRDECSRAAETLRENNVDLVVMDCPGYDMEVKKIIQQITGKPVVLVRTAVATIIKQLVD
jgi:protein AroM